VLIFLGIAVHFISLYEPGRQFSPSQAFSQHNGQATGNGCLRYLLGAVRAEVIIPKFAAQGVIMAAWETAFQNTGLTLGAFQNIPPQGVCFKATGWDYNLAALRAMTLMMRHGYLLSGRKQNTTNFPHIILSPLCLI
jgi:hypothetical protein